MHRSSSLLVLVFILLRLETTKCRNVEETLMEVNELLNSTNVKSLKRRSQDRVQVNPIWQEYEFGTNAGNREGNCYRINVVN